MNGKKRKNLQEPHKRREQKIDTSKEVECIKIVMRQERREKLLKDGIGHVLRLTRHAHGLRPHVHGEDLRRPDPDGGAPRRLVEEGKEEEQKDDTDADGLGLGRRARRLGADDGDDEHADAHAYAADDEQELAAETVDGPGRVEREDDAKGRVQGVDERDLVAVGKHVLVDDGRVGVQRALARDLLARVDDEGEEEPLAHRAVLPEGQVAGRDGLLFELERLADDEDLVFDFLLRVAHLAQRLPRLFDVVAVLDVPAWGAGDEEDEGEDDAGDQELEDDDHFPVPFSGRGQLDSS